MNKYLDSVFEEATASQTISSLGAIVYDASGKTLYKGCFGKTDIEDPNSPPMKSNTILPMQSCGKLVTVIAAFQLLEQDKFSLDDLVEKYCPRITTLEVLEGFKDEDGSPITRPAKTKPTMLNLLTHTTGLSYDFWHEPTFRWAQWAGKGRAEVWADFEVPLLCDPGTKFIYGFSIDWLGFAIEAIIKMPLNDYVQKHIAEPLGLKQTGANPDLTNETKTSYIRDPTGASNKLIALPDMNSVDPDPSKRRLCGGGAGFWSSLDDYSQILLTLLNNGTHPVSKVQLLKPETVERYVFTDALAWLDPPLPSTARVGDLPQSAAPGMANKGGVLPEGMVRGWSCGSLLLNTEEDVTLHVAQQGGTTKTLPGRRKGSAAWVGLLNHWYWIDRTAGVTGLLITGLLPFRDTEVVRVFGELEGAVYQHLLDKGKA